MSADLSANVFPTLHHGHGTVSVNGVFGIDSPPIMYNLSNYAKLRNSMAKKLLKPIIVLVSLYAFVNRKQSPSFLVL